ncbi:STYKc [Geosmithia morbida]|uniref:cyclin-dependent kinase n=1 Tax=Geosmithia morbida TaxID=1094350 RepID=A0A9P4YU12_9HYPO|nr:STYKc [Geosmithia morbida]KAF4123081.1 STYKc [Geosmithia morbida]
MPSAVSIEQETYHSSSSKQEYLDACQAQAPSTRTREAPVSAGHHDPDVPGIPIGPHPNCHPIASGITSQVYRAGSTALKVIVAHTEPHNPQREVRILESLRGTRSIIQLLDAFRDAESQLVLAFPYMPLTLADVIARGTPARPQVVSIVADVLRALSHIHSLGIIHRDVKPSAVLLESPSGPAHLSDFGTAWHPEYSSAKEPASAKILDIGTGPYRAPEVLFGHGAYGAPVDMWAVGVVLSEMVRTPAEPIFESRPAHEDGSQLGLILSIFKTLGTPTPETWPEAQNFKVTPFELWTVFPARPWDELLPGVGADWRDLIAGLLRFDAKRMTADAALQSSCFFE